MSSEPDGDTVEAAAPAAAGVATTAVDEAAADTDASLPVAEGAAPLGLEPRQGDAIQPFHASKLPGKVVSNVVEALKSHSDQVTLLLVCKGWSKAVAESMYRAPPLSNSDSFERFMGLLNTPNPFHPYSAMIRELDISGMAADNLYMGDLDAALSMCPNLEVFRLEGCFHISNILVQSIAHNCPNLLQLDLPGCPVSDTFIPILTKKCRHLLRLDMSFTNATIASIHPIITHAESLLELDLSECRESDDLTSLDLSNKGFRRPLKSLNLRNTPVTDDLLRYAVSQCPELEIVVLESCPKITDDAVMKLINTCTRLRSLDCSFCDRITDLSLNALTVRGAASGGGTIEELYLSACDLITPRAVQQMVQRNTRLCLLVLDGCEQIMGSFVQDLSVTRGDELECSLEEEQLRALATTRVEPLDILTTPPATPPRVPNTSTATVGGLKFEVTYATDSASLRRKANAGYAASAMAAAKEALASGNPFRPGTSDKQKGRSEEYGGSPNNAMTRRKSSRSLRHRRSLLGLSARPEEAEEDTLEAARFERQEKIREKRRSRGSLRVPNLTNSGDHPEDFSGNAVQRSSSLRMVAGPLVAEPVDDDVAAKAAFLAAAAARGVKISAPGSVGLEGPVGSSPLTKRSSVSSLKVDVPEFIPQQEQQSGGWTQPSSAPARRASATVDPWAQPPTSARPPSRASTTVTQAPPPRRLSVGQPAGPAQAGSWTPPTGITPSPLIAGSSVSASVPQPASPSVAASDAGVLLFSGRASRASRENLAAAAQSKQNASPEPQDGPAGEEPAPVLIASGRRRTRGNSVTEEARAPAAAASAAAAGLVQVPPPSVDSTPPNWQSATPTASAAAPWGTDPTAWNNPAQLTSSSSTWSSTGVSAGPPGFADPWAKPPSVPASSPAGTSSVLGPSPVINTADPWAAPPPASVAAVSTPVTQTNGFAPPSVLTPMQPVVPPSAAAPIVTAAVAAQWGPTPSTPVSTTVPVPAPAPPTRQGSVGGWTPATSAPIPGTNGWGPSVPAAAAAGVAPGSPSRPPRPTSIASGRFGSLGTVSAAAANPARASWAPGMHAPAPRGSSVIAGSSVDGGSKENGAVPTPSTTGPVIAAGAVSPQGEFVFSNAKRGRMLLKLRIETKTGGHQALSVHEFDDPQQLASEFVAFWDMQAFKEPLVRLITVRKNNVLRSRQH